MKIKFTKMSGAGNDFVVVDNRSGIITNSNQFAISVCNRRLGIGADGVLLVENSTQAAFKMLYFNADGTSVGMCGNGGRCIAKFSFDNKIVTSETFAFEAFGYVYDTTRHAPTIYELKMKDPVEPKLNQSIKINGKTINGNFLDTGSAHSVIFLDENSELGAIESVNVVTIGKAIRYNEVYQPKGANINFVSKIGSNRIKIRTYERGVEDETLACGTGSVASALLSTMKYGWSGPVDVNVQSGETLRISFKKSGERFTDVRLKGSAVVTFTGEVEFNNNL